MRLIDADALRECVENHVTSVSVCATVQQAIGQTGFKQRCLEDIDNAPTVETVRHGRWIEETDRHYHWHCSECLTVQGVSSIAMKYCPECGALMEMHPLMAATANPGP